MSPRTSTSGPDFSFFKSKRTRSRQIDQGKTKKTQDLDKMKKHQDLEKIRKEGEFKKKLVLVRKDLVSLEEECLQQGFKKEQLVKLFAPLVSLIKRARYERLLIIISIIVILGGLFLQVPSLSWTLSAVGRVTLVKVLPYWDWRPLAEAKCLLGRENIEVDSEDISTSDGILLQADCDVCELLSDIDRVNSTTSEFLKQNYFSRGAPVVITDVPKHSESIVLSILSNDQLLDTFPCEVYTNLQLPPFGTVDELLALRAYTTLNSSFVYIQNCEKIAIKALRLLTERPYFYSRLLPTPYVNWVLISDNYDGVFKRLSIDGFATFFQISGEFETILSPREPCIDICFDLITTIKEGETLVWCSLLWYFEIRAVAGVHSEAILTVTDGTP